MIDWIEPDEEERRDLVRAYSEDREDLVHRLDLLYPRFAHWNSADKVELILMDVCGFHVVDAPLSLGQLARCDFSARTIIWNSRTVDFANPKTNLKLLKQSTLAHELGHLRLHWDELKSGLSLNYWGDTRQFSDSRSFQREREADLYASVFLVPIDELLLQRPVKNLLKNRQDKREMRSSTLWSMVYRLAKGFSVSPTLMKRTLVDLGWLHQERGKRGKNGKLLLRLRF